MEKSICEVGVYSFPLFYANAANQNRSHNKRGLKLFKRQEQVIFMIQ